MAAVKGGGPAEKYVWTAGSPQKRPFPVTYFSTKFLHCDLPDDED